MQNLYSSDRALNCVKNYEDDVNSESEKNNDFTVTVAPSCDATDSTDSSREVNDG